MSDPISWLLIEKGWRVYATDGSELGKVADITGDGEADIFDGLAVDAGFLVSRATCPEKPSPRSSKTTSRYD